MQSKGLSRIFSNTTVQKHQFFGAQLSLQCLVAKILAEWATLRNSHLIYFQSISFSPNYIQYSLTITNSWSLPKLMSIELVMPTKHLILCRPLLLPPSIFPSIRVFSNESDLHIRWPKYWSFSFSISPSSEYSGLISFRMDWLDLLAVQGTLKSLLQHHNSKASILGAQLSLWSNSHIHT